MQKITVIDDSSYSVPSMRVVDVEHCAENIAGLKSDMEGLQKQIDAKLSQIAEYQADIDAGADAGVMRAVSLSSAVIKPRVE